MNHNINYLHFCLNNQNLYLYKEVKVDGVSIPKKTKIRLESFTHDKDGIDLTVIKGDIATLGVRDGYKFTFHLNWDEEIPFTHFKEAKEAYVHCRFTKIPMSIGLEDFIFDRSPKFATEYATHFNKRVSNYLETKIFRNPKYLFQYSKHFSINLSEEQEKTFLKDDDGNWVAKYGLEKIRGRLCEMLHNYILMVVANQKIKAYYPSRYLELYGKS